MLFIKWQRETYSPLPASMATGNTKEGEVTDMVLRF
jgi:hypothetical protein